MGRRHPVRSNASYPPAAVIVFDSNLRLVSAGGSAQADAGWVREPLVGRTISEAFPPSVVEVIEPLCRQALAGCESNTDVEFGDRVFAQQLGPMYDDHGAIIAGMGFTQDVTESRRAAQQLRDSEQHFRLAFELSPIALALIGLDGRYLEVNPAMCRLTGFTYQQLVQRTVADLTHPDELAADTSAMAALLAGDRSTYTIDKRLFTSNNTLVWVAKTSTLVPTSSTSPVRTPVAVNPASARAPTDPLSA